LASKPCEKPYTIEYYLSMEDEYTMTMLELYRRAQGWSQAALAGHLGPGFTASAISLIEGRRLRPSARQLERLRELFGDEAEAMLAPIDPARIGVPQGEAW
jgi:transcriptional regulator with XRE-family HTH domain